MSGSLYAPAVNAYVYDDRDSETHFRRRLSSENGFDGLLTRDLPRSTFHEPGDGTGDDDLSSPPPSDASWRPRLLLRLGLRGECPGLDDMELSAYSRPLRYSARDPCPSSFRFRSVLVDRLSTDRRVGAGMKYWGTQRALARFGVLIECSNRSCEYVGRVLLGSRIWAGGMWSAPSSRGGVSAVSDDSDAAQSDMNPECGYPAILAHKCIRGEAI